MTDPLSQRPVPLLTPELPGTSGIIRVADEDFQVEELPLYPASGVGEHLYLTSVTPRLYLLTKLIMDLGRNPPPRMK